MSNRRLGNFFVTRNSKRCVGNYLPFDNYEPTFGEIWREVDVPRPGDPHRGLPRDFEALSVRFSTTLFVEIPLRPYGSRTAGSQVSSLVGNSKSL